MHFGQRQCAAFTVAYSDQLRFVAEVRSRQEVRHVVCQSYCEGHCEEAGMRENSSYAALDAVQKMRAHCILSDDPRLKGK